MEQILRQEGPVVREPGHTTRSRDTDGRGATDLPLRVTSFVGRESMLERVVDRLAVSRLVTLAGPGGAGKTALAVEAARVAAPARRDGARLVRLAPVVDADGVCHAVADAVGFGIEGGTVALRSLDLLTRRLVGRDVLSYWTTASTCWTLSPKRSEAILSSCPGVRILATSREALAVAGEVQIPVPPLEVPAVSSCRSGFRRSHRPGSSWTGPPLCCRSRSARRQEWLQSQTSADDSTGSRWRWSWPQPG